MVKSKVVKAYLFSEQAHKDGVRKFSGLPYFTHPKGVAKILDDFDASEVLLIGALLHDVLEDTEVNFSDISKKFDIKIALLVLELTNDDKEIKEFGKAEYLRNKVSSMSDDAFTIKLADRLHNLMHLLGNDVPINFIKKYYFETKYIFDNLKRGRTTELQDTLKELIDYTLALINDKHNFEG